MYKYLKVRNSTVIVVYLNGKYVSMANRFQSYSLNSKKLEPILRRVNPATCDVGDKVTEVQSVNKLLRTTIKTVSWANLETHKQTTPKLLYQGHLSELDVALGVEGLDGTPINLWSTLNFKEYLTSQGVDTKLFWKNCKKKHQKWRFFENNRPRKKLQKSHPSLWAGGAFSYENSLEKKDWRAIHGKWHSWVKRAEREGTTIVFGFDE